MTRIGSRIFSVAYHQSNTLRIRFPVGQFVTSAFTLVEKWCVRGPKKNSTTQKFLNKNYEGETNRKSKKKKKEGK